LPAGFAADIIDREMQKALPIEAPFIFASAVSAPAGRSAQSRRFPNPSEVKTSPKSWRQLSLLDLAGSVLVDESNKGRLQQWR